MQTNGREEEKAFVQASSYYRAGVEPHLTIIDAFHDWAEGKLAAAEVLILVCASIDEKPTTSVLDTTSRWVRRAVVDERAFEAFVPWLAQHKQADVRAWASGEMREPRTESEHALFGKLLQDRSTKVRRATVNSAEAWRWYSVVDALRSFAGALPSADERADILRACAFIEHGFVREGEYVRYYSGDEPGGGGANTTVPSSHVADVPFDRISADELTFRHRHGVWPTRPEGVSFNARALAAWRPLAD